MTTSGEPFELFSKSRIKLTRSLKQKKNRDLEKLFVAEGDKIVREYIRASNDKSCKIRFVCATPEWLGINQDLILASGITTFHIDYKELKGISSLVTPQEVLAVVEMFDPAYRTDLLKKRVTLAFESIRDPGNLGTIIRTADWFGIKVLICSPDSVDFYNPKVIQSAMGSTLRVKVIYMPLNDLIKDARAVNIPVFGTCMDGKDLYEEDFPAACIMLFGNESSGLDLNLIERVDKKISIPEFPEGNKSAESLNIASAVAVISSELRRRERKSYSK